jgi:hypothetical protein
MYFTDTDRAMMELAKRQKALGMTPDPEGERLLQQEAAGRWMATNPDLRTSGTDTASLSDAARKAWLDPRVGQALTGLPANSGVKTAPSAVIRMMEQSNQALDRELAARGESRSRLLASFRARNSDLSAQQMQRDYEAQRRQAEVKYPAPQTVAQEDPSLRRQQEEMVSRWNQVTAQQSQKAAWGGPQLDSAYVSEEKARKLRALLIGLLSPVGQVSGDYRVVVPSATLGVRG